VQRLALALVQVLGAQALVAILAATDVVEVVAGARQTQRRSSTSRLPRSA
jgi:hypothetical protein